jgi:cytochrome c-type biogenesis protein CcmH/NrfG
LASVFALAVLTRLAVLASTIDLPIVRTPKLDALEYVSWARRIAEGAFASPTVSAHGPGYPLFLAAVFAAGGSIGTALIIQALLGATTAACVAGLATRWFGRPAGLLAGMVYAVFGPVVFVETNLLGESLLLLFLTAAVLMISSKPTRIELGISGALLGCAVLVRPTATLIAGSVAIAAFIGVGRSVRRSLLLTLTGGFLLVVGPVLLYGALQSQSLSIQGYGGLNFYIGNSPAHTGLPSFRLGAGWDGLNAAARRAGATDPLAEDRWYVRKTLGEIEQHPLGYLRLLANKALWLIQAAEVRDTHSFYFFAEQSPVLRVLPRMALLIPFAAIGVVECLRRRQLPPTLVAYFVGAALGVVLFVMGTRYRIPTVPALAIWAGVGIAACGEAASAHSLRRCLAFGAVALAAIVSGHLLTDRSSQDLAEEWAFTGSSFITEHRLSDADAAYRTALVLDPNSAFAWDGLGLTLLDGAQWDEARAAFTRAAKLQPVSASISFHRALVAEHDGQLDDAVNDERDALAIDPTNLEADRHLATALLQLRRDPEAIPVLHRIIQHDPANSASHHALAQALAGIGDLTGADREMTASLQLNPGDGEGWLELCLLDLDRGFVEDAVRALERAREYGAAPERVAFATRALDVRRERR